MSQLHGSIPSTSLQSSEYLISGTAQAQHGSSPILKYRVLYVESHTSGSISGTARLKPSTESTEFHTPSPIHRYSDHITTHIIYISRSHIILITSPALTYVPV